MMRAAIVSALLAVTPAVAQQANYIWACEDPAEVISFTNAIHSGEPPPGHTSCVQVPSQRVAGSQLTIEGPSTEQAILAVLMYFPIPGARSRVLWFRLTDFRAFMSRK